MAYPTPNTVQYVRDVLSLSGATPEERMAVQLAKEVSVELAEIVVPGMEGAADTLQAMQAGSMEGMVEGGCEILVDFIPVGRLMHAAKDCRRLVELQEKLHKLMELAKKFKRRPLKPRVPRRRPTSHSGIHVGAAAMMQPDRWVGNCRYITKLNGVELHGGLLVEVVPPVNAISKIVDEGMRKQAFLTAEKYLTTAQHSRYKNAIDVAKRFGGLTEKLVPRADGGFDIVWSAPGCGDVVETFIRGTMDHTLVRGEGALRSYELHAYNAFRKLGLPL